MSVGRRILVLWMFFYSNVSMTSQVAQASFISLNFHNEPAVKVFEEIQKQTGLVFSYGGFNDQIRISILLNQVTLNDVISTLEKELNVRIVRYDKYLIIKSSGNDYSKEVFISGVVSDFDKKIPLQSASIFNKEKRRVVQSDANGRFRMKLPRSNKNVIVNIAKNGFVDTTVILVASENQHINIALRTYKNYQIQELETLESKKISIDRPFGVDRIPEPEIIESSFIEKFWAKKKLRYLHLQNIKDTLLRNFSISVLPALSYNKRLSFNTINTLSLNIIGGHSKGVEGVEFGTVYNLDAGNMVGLQIVGGVNQVKDHMTGLQLAGGMNGVGGNIAGLQLAGLYNLVDRDIRGAQVSGLIQKGRQVLGLQMAGVLNRAVQVNGIQVSGGVNYTDSTIVGLQLAGILNKSKNLSGVQIASINICDSLSGIQVGLVNHAGYVSAGFMLGLVNHANNGVSAAELAINDLGTFSIGYRSGWAPLHMHYFGGLNLQSINFWFAQLGVGLASSISIHQKWRMEFGLSASTNRGISENSNWEFNLHNQLFAGLSWRPFKVFGVRAGLTWHHLWYDTSSSVSRHIADKVAGRSVFTAVGNQRSQSMWPGWQVAFVF